MSTSRVIGRGMTNLLQENSEMLTGSMQVAELNHSTEIKYYNFSETESTQQGYQRPLAKTRINKMSNGLHPVGIGCSESYASIRSIDVLRSISHRFE